MSLIYQCQTLIIHTLFSDFDPFLRSHDIIEEFVWSYIVDNKNIPLYNKKIPLYFIKIRSSYFKDGDSHGYDF